jgi:hypothetical protein
MSKVLLRHVAKLGATGILARAVAEHAAEPKAKRTAGAKR